MPFRAEDPTFAGLEIAPQVIARIDTAKYRTGLKRARNVLGQPAGGVTKRTGFEFVGEVNDSSKLARLLSFQFSADQALIIIAEDQMAEYAASGGLLIDTKITITGITNAFPAVVTSPAHGYATGKRVYFSGILGMVELNETVARVTVIDANNYAIDVDTTTYGVFTGDTGGVDGASGGSTGGHPATPPTTPAPTTPITIPVPTIPAFPGPILPS